VIIATPPGIVLVYTRSPICPLCVCVVSPSRTTLATSTRVLNFMPRAITARHDTLVQILANMFKRAGVVNIEVKCEGETRVRPDLEIILSDRSLLVDVAVVHPAAPSRRSLVALAAARDIENAKAAKYRSVALERGATFSAFIVESYGALGGQGLELLKLLNAQPCSRSPFRALGEVVDGDSLCGIAAWQCLYISHGQFSRPSSSCLG